MPRTFIMILIAPWRNILYQEELEAWRSSKCARTPISYLRLLRREDRVVAPPNNHCQKCCFSSCQLFRTTALRIPLKVFSQPEFRYNHSTEQPPYLRAQITLKLETIREQCCSNRHTIRWMLLTRHYNGFQKKGSTSPRKLIDVTIVWHHHLMGATML